MREAVFLHSNINKKYSEHPYIFNSVLTTSLWVGVILTGIWTEIKHVKYYDIEKLTKSGKYSITTWVCVQINTVMIFPNRIELVIDDEDKGQEQSGSTSISDTGGVLFLGKEKFKGCISNLYTRR